MSITWNTGPAAERARHNLRLKKKLKRNKKLKLKLKHRRHQKDTIM
jgi:hypothetical protein